MDERPIPFPLDASNKAKNQIRWHKAAEADRTIDKIVRTKALQTEETIYTRYNEQSVKQFGSAVICPEPPWAGKNVFDERKDRQLINKSGLYEKV